MFQVNRTKTTAICQAIHHPLASTSTPTPTTLLKEVPATPQLVPLGTPLRVPRDTHLLEDQWDSLLREAQGIQAVPQCHQVVATEALRVMALHRKVMADLLRPHPHMEVSSSTLKQFSYVSGQSIFIELTDLNTAF